MNVKDEEILQLRAKVESLRAIVYQKDVLTDSAMQANDLLRAECDALRGEVEKGELGARVLQSWYDECQQEREQLSKINKLQAAALDVWKRGHPHEANPDATGCASYLAPFLAVARAAQDYLHGQATAFDIADKILALRDALAHPAVQERLKEAP